MLSHISKEAILYKYFEDHKLYPSYIDGIENILDGMIYEAEICWGDWKHDHLRFEYLVKHDLGGMNLDGRVTEENGSDCYSMIHRFYVYDGVIETLSKKYDVPEIYDKECC